MAHDNVMRKPRAGLSLIELIVVLAVVGILAGIGITTFNYGGVATRQAAQVVSASVNRARLEAIRSNQTIGIMFVVEANGTGFIRVCSGVDLSAAQLSCPTDAAFTVERIDFAAGDLARARLVSVTPTANVFFDRRGILRQPTQTLITISDRSGENERTVTMLPTGRTVIQ